MENVEDDLHNMMEVDFPGFHPESSQEDEGGENDLSRAPMVDIESEGWDDDAAVRCFNLALSYHDADGSKCCYEFQPMPSKGKDVIKEAQSNDITISATTSEDVINSGRKEGSWNPIAMLKPKWATDPSDEKEMKES